MPAVFAHRTLRRLASLVLACLLLVLGLATAAPLRGPGSDTFICSSTGGASQPDPDAGAQARHALDCPLCVAVAPPSQPPVLPRVPTRPGFTRPFPGARPLPGPLAALPPARGPPPLS